MKIIFSCPKMGKPAEPTFQTIHNSFMSKQLFLLNAVIIHLLMKKPINNTNNFQFSSLSSEKQKKPRNFVSADSHLK